ncbi:hypothetical protein RYX36_005675, partial [Vicia faba]
FINITNRQQQTPHRIAQNRNNNWLERTLTIIKMCNNSKRFGPFKTCVDTVEEAVKTVIGPVYDKFHQVPVKLLKYVDRKVDESVSKLNRHVPTNVKKVSTQARSVVTEVRRAGVVESASGLAKTVYS